MAKKFVLGQKDVTRLKGLMAQNLSPDGVPTSNAAIPTYLCKLTQNVNGINEEGNISGGNAELLKVNLDGTLEETTLYITAFNISEDDVLEDLVCTVVRDPLSGCYIITGSPNGGIATDTSDSASSYTAVEANSVNYDNPLHLMLPTGFVFARIDDQVISCEQTVRWALITENVGASSGEGDIQEYNGSSWTTRHSGVTIRDFSNIGATSGQRVPVLYAGAGVWGLVNAGCAT